MRDSHIPLTRLEFIKLQKLLAKGNGISNAELDKLLGERVYTEAKDDKEEDL